MSTSHPLTGFLNFATLLAKLNLAYQVCAALHKKTIRTHKHDKVALLHSSGL